MKGAAAMSVEMCAVTETSSADGTAASATKLAASRQPGGGAGSARAASADAFPVRSIVHPQAAISAMSM